MINKINVYVKAIENTPIIADDCKSSIEIIGKTVLASIIKKLENYEINIIASHSIHESDIDFENILVINTFTLSDFNFIKRFNNKIYFFDDLDMWKIYNIQGYAENLIFDSYLIPNENIAKELSAKLNNVYYAPYSGTDAVLLNDRNMKSSKVSIFIDIWPLDRGDLERGRLSLEKALYFFNQVKDHNLEFYVHEKFSDFIFGPNVKYIKDLPRKLFYDFIKTIWFYATSIKSSYEFIILESTINGAMCIDICNSVNIEHLKSKSVISSEYFYANYDRLISEFDPVSNSSNAHFVYSAENYINIFNAALKYE